MVEMVEMVDTVGKVDMVDMIENEWMRNNEYMDMVMDIVDTC